MKTLVKAPLLVVALMLSGCGQSDESHNGIAENSAEVGEACNKTLLSALPDAKSLTVARYTGTDCTYNMATRFWEKDELQISVQIMDRKAELPSEIAALGMNEMIDHANALSYGMAKGIVSSTRKTLDEVAASPEMLAFFGGEAYLPIIIQTPNGEDAAVSFAREGGAGPLFSVINDRFVITIDRSDAREFADNKATEQAYKPLFESIHFSFLR